MLAQTVMPRLTGEFKVYSEFFTNGAVAWFSAGVIAPLFAKQIGVRELLASVIAILFCFVFLKLATDFSFEDIQ